MITPPAVPHAAVLERCEGETYAGVALKNAEGETIGLCSVMFKAGHAENGEDSGPAASAGPARRVVNWR